MRARGKTLAFALTVMILHLTIHGAAQTSPATVPVIPAQRLGHLRRGINLSEWFAQVWDPKGYTKEHLQTWTTVDDIVLIQKMGFDHVRLNANVGHFGCGGSAKIVKAKIVNAGGFQQPPPCGLRLFDVAGPCFS